MRLTAVMLSVVIGAAAFAPSGVDAAAVRVTHAHVYHRPIHPAYRPGHRAVVAHPVARRSVVIGPGYRPVHPWWRPGGAIAAGAAIGFVAAATAVTWAGPPPGPTYCWYYTDPTRTKGFWDLCPM